MLACLQPSIKTLHPLQAIANLPNRNCLRLQAHHNARELMLTQVVDGDLEGDTLLRPCAVVASEAELAAAAGDDVFLCDHQYDTAWDVSAS